MQGDSFIMTQSRLFPVLALSAIMLASGCVTAVKVRRSLSGQSYQSPQDGSMQSLPAVPPYDSGAGSPPAEAPGFTDPPPPPAEARFLPTMKERTVSALESVERRTQSLFD
jgi:hypothetical protein